MSKSALLPGAEAGLIQIQPGLPCAMRKETGIRCGRSATVAWGDPVVAGLNTGSWYLIPICQDCARETLSLYSQPAVQHTATQQPVSPAERLVSKRRAGSQAGSLADIRVLYPGRNKKREAN